MPVYLILVISTLTTVGAQLCLKKGVLKLEALQFSLPGIFSLILQTLQNLWLMGGLVLFGVSFLLWLLLLSKMQLNVLYPIATGLNFCLLAVASWFLFKEYLSVLQIFGIAIIILGIFLALPKGSL